MKFWRHSQENSPKLIRSSSTLRRRRSRTPNDSSIGVTFVELIKRPGSELGIRVSKDSSRISDLISGSWAQRSDVLIPGDTLFSIHGISTRYLTDTEIYTLLESVNKVQLVIHYKLPPSPALTCPSKATRKIVQVSLSKNNGSFGFVIRGGVSEIPENSRPFTVMHVSSNGPAFTEGSIRPLDRILSINGLSLSEMKLPELQSLLYSLDSSTVFMVEYDIYTPSSSILGKPLLIEIQRSLSDQIGFGLQFDRESQTYYIESIRTASLAERTGSLHVGDILLSINKKSLSFPNFSGVESVIQFLTETSVVQLEILPRSSSNLSSLSLKSRHRFRRNEAFDSLSVDLERNGGPLGLTLSTENEVHVPGSHISISSLTPNGLAERSQRIKVHDVLNEINGLSIKNLSLNDVIDLLEDEKQSDIVSLKLIRPLEKKREKIGKKPPKIPPRSSTLEIIKVTLFKDRVYEDFGFSVSDGLHEKGIYVNRIRKGGPAYRNCSLLRPYDRILQINDISTSEYDCILAVPLIASSGDKLELLVTRCPKFPGSRETSGSSNILSWMDDDENENDDRI